MAIQAASAQQFLSIEAIKDDIAVLKDGQFRIVLMCSSLNFALKSSEEQDAITFQYQNFLNSLDFPIQIVTLSRLLNITPYIETLKAHQHEEDNEYLKIQIGEYIDFIQVLVGSANIMSKTFYVVIPYSPPVLEKKGILSDALRTIGLSGSGKEGKAQDDATFEEHKLQLWQRVDTIIEGLKSFGVRSAPLNTEELVELFYGLYNPTEFEKTASIVE